MPETPNELAILRGWVTLRLNVRLNGYVSRQCLCLCDGGMVLLQHCPGSFHTKKPCSGLYSIEIEFYFLNVLSQPLGT